MIILAYPNKENINSEPIDLTIKNKIMFYCNELSFGKLSFCSYLNIETILFFLIQY